MNWYLKNCLRPSSLADKKRIVKKNKSTTFRRDYKVLYDIKHYTAVYTEPRNAHIQFVVVVCISLINF